MSDIVLYGHPQSGHACKVALALSLMRVEHTSVFVDIWGEVSLRPKEFLQHSPFAEVPLLRVDGRSFVQSGAILLFLAEHFQALGGETPLGLQRGREIILWEANRIGMCLPQLKEARRVDEKGYPPEVCAWLHARFAVDCQRFDILLGEADFFHGEAVGIGDCAVWGYTQWLQEAGVQPSARMQQWLLRMRGLPQMKTPEAFFPV